LYVSTGDNTNPFESDGYGPMDESPGRSPFDAQASSANPNDLRGKILRIHPKDDGTYAIPDGNLFPVATGILIAYPWISGPAFSIGEKWGRMPARTAWEEDLEDMTR
jgi:hypothetical protein